eukprot:CAMPEP_0113941872 /NCGR_PEP_ID=MMETSP1339-20121228/7710_1 /TAXON_ID=94617 /ORGANISM="Fibrocapsa japonica" /LENGTH=303 /DNA_ID=CAMNT_0000946153 /DNA_START=107 /DNA_END=1015 /DNA_ORIENTATION=- /assembly_acc=CAM_ASM_000762
MSFTNGGLMLRGCEVSFIGTLGRFLRPTIPSHRLLHATVNRNEDENSEKESKATEKTVGTHNGITGLGYPLPRALSPTSVQDFRICPTLFKFRHLDKAPEPSSPALVRGLVVHDCLAKLFDQQAARRTTRLALREIFDGCWDEHKSNSADRFAACIKSEEEEEKVKESTWRSFQNYLLLERPGSVEPLEREHRMFATLGEPETGTFNVTGVLDRLDRTSEGGLRVVDYKTGKGPDLKYSHEMNKRILEDKFFQLKMYAVMIAQDRQQIPVELKLMYLEDLTVLTMPLTAADVGATYIELKEVW